jgi:hypothetical protein
MKNDILNAIRQAAKLPGAFSVLATVSAVDTEENTCDCVPMYEAPDLLDVKLFPRDEDGEMKKGLLLVPKVGSVVVVSFINNQDTGFISMCSEVDEIHLNGENYKGLVKIEELVDKLNALENKVNTIISTFNAHTHPYVDSGSPAVTSVTATLVAGTLTPTQVADLENDTVLHGDGQ